MYRVTIYEKIPSIIENNHKGNIVLFLYPIPNNLMDPLFLKRNCGLFNITTRNAKQ